MRVSRWLPPGVVLIILGVFTQDGSSTMIMGSMLLGSMAANTAMLLGKMSLGGLMMMMMSQQNGGGGETGNLLASLGNLGRTLGSTLNTLSGAASNTNKRTTRSHAPVSPPVASTAASSGAGGVVKKVRYSRPHQSNPTQGQSHSGHPHHGHSPVVQEQVQSWPAQTSTPVQIQGYNTPTLQDQQILNQLHQEIQRQQLQQQYRKRVARSAGELLAPAQTANANSADAPTTTSTIAPSQPLDADSAQSASGEIKPPEEDDEEVTKKLLTYTRLMRQADTFDYMTCLPKFVCGLEAQPPTKKTSILNDYSHLLKLFFGPDDDDDELDDELPSDEDMNGDSVDAYRLALSNKERMDDKLNDELLSADPDMLSYVLKDIADKGIKKQKNKFGYQPPMGHYYPSMDLPPEEDEPPKSGSILSSFLPKISAGFGTKTEDPAFDDDPFFSGYKRSLDMPVVGVDTVGTLNANNEINVNDFEDGQGQNVKRSKRISDNSRKRRKREAVEEIIQNDPVIAKYRRAQEIGRQSKQKGVGQRDCSNAFRKCPYAWDQIMGMISNMRDMIIPSNMTTKNRPSSQDKVVVLQVPTSGAGKTSATKTYTRNGAQKITHDLGNGNVMQITLKLAPKVTGFEPVPVVESEPYQENDELDVESVKLIPTKPLAKVTTTAKPKRKLKPKPVGPAGELDTVDPATEEETSEEFSEEQQRVVGEAAQKLHSQNIGNGTRKAKPKRKFKPSPNTNFDFASDVDVMGVKGGTILPNKGADKVVNLKRRPGVPASTTTTTTARPRTRSTTTTTIKPSGSENGKKGKRPVHAHAQEPYKINKKDPAQVAVTLPTKKGEDVKPAASYKDNSDDTTSEENDNDDESDEGDLDLEDDLEAAEDEFILDDRNNDFRSHDTHKKRRRPLPISLHFDDPPQHQNEPVHMSNHRPPQNGPTGGGGSKLRRPPFPMMMRKPPILHDESGSWVPIGEQARALSEGQQQQQPESQQ